MSRLSRSALAVPRFFVNFIETAAGRSWHENDAKMRDNAAKQQRWQTRDDSYPTDRRR